MKRRWKMVRVERGRSARGSTARVARYKPGTTRHLIDRARVAGFEVYLLAGRVVIDGPTAKHPDLAFELEENRAAVLEQLLADVDRALERWERSARGTAFWVEHGTPAEREHALKLTERARRRAMWAIFEASRDVLPLPPSPRPPRRLVGGRS